LDDWIDDENVIQAVDAFVVELIYATLVSSRPR